MNFNTNFSSPFFNFSSGAANKYNNAGNMFNGYSSNYQPTFDTTNFNTLKAGCTKKTNTPNQDQTSTGTSITSTAAMQMMMNMMSMMMQMMQNVMQNSGTGTGTSPSGSGTSASGAADLTTASDSTLTSAQSSIASQWASPGSATYTSNQTLVNQIANADPNSTDSVTAQVSLINANSSANPQSLQSFALLQALRGQNSTLDSLNGKTGFSATRSQTTTARNNTISALQTLQTRPLSTEELSALPINNQVKQALLPTSLTASQILDLNAYNDRDASYTPPGGVYFNTTQPTTLTLLQSQYLFYQGQQAA